MVMVTIRETRPLRALTRRVPGPVPRGLSPSASLLPSANRAKGTRRHLLTSPDVAGFTRDLQGPRLGRAQGVRVLVRG